MAFSKHLKTQIFDRLIRAQKLSIALYQNDPGADDEAEEVSGDSYARQEVKLSAFANGRCVNTNQIDFPVVQNSWGTVAFYGVRDEDNNLLFSGRFEAPVNLIRYTQFRMPPGALTVGA